MAEPSVLERLVRQIGWQVRRRRAEYYGLRGAFYGAIVGVVPLVLKESVGPSAPLLAVGLVALGAAAGILRGATLAVPAKDAARILDRSFGLRDRAATALEWGGRPDASFLVDLLVADVTTRLGGLDSRRIVPRFWPRELRLLPLPVLLIVVLALAPPIPLPTGGLPSFLAGSDSETTEERLGKVLVHERPTGKARELRRAEMRERSFPVRPGGTGASQPGDLAALFRDTALSAQRPDFQSFLKKGDERLRLLEQVDRLPDLQRDFTRSQYKVAFQKTKKLFGGLRPDQFSPEKLRELLEEMERMGRGTGGEWTGDIGEGMDALDAGESARALEALQKALSKMRSMEERHRRGRGLRGGREEDRRGDRAGDPDGWDEMDPEFGFGEGLLPGHGRSEHPKGQATSRLGADPFDTGVEGQSRSGRKEGYDTNLFGRGGNVPSRLQYMGVLTQYRRMMEEALAREQIPRDYQSQVKKYFDSLEERR